MGICTDLYVLAFLYAYCSVAIDVSASRIYSEHIARIRKRIFVFFCPYLPKDLFLLLSSSFYHYYYSVFGLFIFALVNLLQGIIRARLIFIDDRDFGYKIVYDCQLKLFYVCVVKRVQLCVCTL